MSDNELTPPELTFVRELRSNPMWREILDKLEHDLRGVPKYKPGKDNPEKQAADWGYYSGLADGRQAVIQRLRNG